MKAVIGLALICLVIAVGFIRVDEATWLAWRPAWLLGGGGALGAGIGLLLMQAVERYS